MVDTVSEQVLKAFFSALEAAMPAGAKLVRNEFEPSSIPEAGWVCLRDGDPGDPETFLSPPTYVYEHMAEVHVVVLGVTSDVRDAALDTLKRAVGAATAADRTLGGLCDYVLGDAPAPLELPVEGSADIKAASIGVFLTYATSDPLA